jgi:hypothetical protein
LGHFRDTGVLGILQPHHGCVPTRWLGFLRTGLLSCCIYLVQHCLQRARVLDACAFSYQVLTVAPSFILCTYLLGNLTVTDLLLAYDYLLFQTAKVGDHYLLSVMRRLEFTLLCLYAVCPVNLAFPHFSPGLSVRLGVH